MKSHLLLFILAMALATGCLNVNKSADISNPGRVVARGEERGNGAETFRDEDRSAWFVDPAKKIKTCYQVAPGFGAADARLEAAIQGAFDIWRSYIKEKQIYSDGSGRPGPNADIQLKPNCDGSEDLQFKFGVIDPEVTSALARHKEPVAVSVRTQYDPAITWGKGFVWLASHASLPPMRGETYPNWNLAHTIEGIILHEVGHIFGNSHVPGTIMDEEVTQTIIITVDDFRRQMLTQIDGYNELHICMCDFKQKGYLGDQGLDFDPKTGKRTVPVGNRAKNFELLSGRKPVGEVQSWFITDAKSNYLRISDDLGVYQYEIAAKTGSRWQNEIPITLFKIAKFHQQSFYNYGFQALDATIQTSNGQVLQVRLDRNVSGYSLVEGETSPPVNLVHILLQNPDSVEILFGASVRDLPH